MSKLIWKKQVPNKSGYWLRVNAGHRVQLHHIAKVRYDCKGNEVTGLSSLVTYWGWGGESKLCSVKEIKDKLRYFYWCGPFPEPPKEIL